MKIGLHLRQFRLAQGLTLRQLGKLCVCSASYLSQIEAEKTSPNLDVLERICGALGMELLDFLRSAEAMSEGIPLGYASGPLVWEWEGAILRHILPAHISSPVNYLLLEIEPGKETALRGSRRSQKEMAILIQGEVELEIVQKIYPLKSGEKIYLDIISPHRWRNIGSQPASLVLVNSNFTEVYDLEPQRHSPKLDD